MLDRQEGRLQCQNCPPRLSNPALCSTPRGSALGVDYFGGTPLRPDKFQIGHEAQGGSKSAALLGRAGPEVFLLLGKKNRTHLLDATEHRRH